MAILGNELCAVIFANKFFKIKSQKIVVVPVERNTDVRAFVVVGKDGAIFFNGKTVAVEFFAGDHKFDALIFLEFIRVTQFDFHGE